MGTPLYQPYGGPSHLCVCFTTSTITSLTVILVHTCWKSLIDEIVTQCPYPIQPIPDPTSGSGDTNGNDPNGSADHQTPSERPTFHPGTGKPNEPGSGSGDADAGPADTPSATQTTTNVIHHQDASDDGTDFFDMLNDTSM